jgi:plastocyanin
MAAAEHTRGRIGYARAVHSATAQLLPILAVEKSKVAFYLAGGLLALWAVVVSVGLGLRRPDFPGGRGGQTAVIAITAILVVAAMGSAVLTAGVPASAGGIKGVSGSESAQPTGGSPSALGTAPGGKATASTLSQAADPTGTLHFAKSALTAPAGTVTINFANQAPLPHNLTIAQGTTTIGATPTFQGGSRSLKLNLKPGSYVFYCSVPGHRQGGMQGTLTVN